MVACKCDGGMVDCLLIRAKLFGEILSSHLGIRHDWVYASCRQFPLKALILVRWQGEMSLKSVRFRGTRWVWLFNFDGVAQLGPLAMLRAFSGSCSQILLPLTFDELLDRESSWMVVNIGHHIPRGVRMESSYLVDPASSHMLVSKIKPCMSKYKQTYTVKLRMAH